MVNGRKNINAKLFSREVLKVLSKFLREKIDNFGNKTKQAAQLAIHATE